MNKAKLKTYAPQARRDFIAAVTQRANLLGPSESAGKFEALLAERPDVTAIFAVADVMAIGALKAALDRGLRVPQDLSIVGFDGIPVGLYVHPTLTTLVQPARQIAELTCQILFDNMAGALSAGIGLIGIVVPLLPTTPLMILAAACFARSSPRLHDWLWNHRVFGPAIRDWRAAKRT